MFTPPLAYYEALDSTLVKIFHNSGLYFIDIKKLFNIDNLSDFLYERNRPIDDNKVYEIVKHEKTYKEKYGTYDYHLGKINLATVKSRDLKILDGQHRVKSALFLVGEVFCDIVITDYESEQERFDAYLIINQNTVVDEYYKNYDQAIKYIISESIEPIRKRFPHIFSESRNPYRPNLNFHVFCEKLYGFLSNSSYKYLLDTTDADKAITIISQSILQYNDKMMKMPDTHFPKYSATNRKRSEHYSKATSIGFVLGMYREYEWMRSCFKKKLIFKSR